MARLAIWEFAVNVQGAADLDRRPLPLQAFRQSTVWNSNFEMLSEDSSRLSSDPFAPARVPRSGLSIYHCLRALQYSVRTFAPASYLPSPAGVPQNLNRASALTQGRAAPGGVVGVVPVIWTASAETQ